MYFKSPEHKQRLIAALQRLGKIYRDGVDVEYAAILYILTCTTGMWDRTESYVSAGGIDVQSMLAEQHWSGGFGVLIRLGGNLFNGNERVDPLEFMQLDQDYYRVAVTAISIRRFGWNPEERVNS